MFQDWLFQQYPPIDQSNWTLTNIIMQDHTSSSPMNLSNILGTSNASNSNQAPETETPEGNFFSAPVSAASSPHSYAFESPERISSIHDILNTSSSIQMPSIQTTPTPSGRSSFVASAPLNSLSMMCSAADLLDPKRHNAGRLLPPQPRNTASSFDSPSVIRSRRTDSRTGVYPYPAGAHQLLQQERQIQQMHQAQQPRRPVITTQQLNTSSQQRMAVQYPRVPPQTQPYIGAPLPELPIEDPESKRFQCPVVGCSKTFKRMEHLRRHFRIHTGERPFVCQVPGCGKDFSRSDNLTQHMRTHQRHGGTQQ